MTLETTYRAGHLALSYELFPPKTPQGDAALYRHVRKLLETNPDYITCTFGAGGSTRDKTLEIAGEVKRRHGLPVASHLTCVQASIDQLRAYLEEARQLGIDHIVALRGDPPLGHDRFVPPTNGLRFANELVTLIRSEYPEFGIAVAGYPETHREALSPEDDLANLKRKVDAGADVVITQLFYDNADFFRFRDRYDRVGIAAPLVPGILPITSVAQVQRIAALCDSRLPDMLVKPLSATDDAEAQFQIGIEHSTRQVEQLARSEVPGVHFFVLNRSQATLAILRNVNLHRV